MNPDKHGVDPRQYTFKTHSDVEKKYMLLFNTKAKVFFLTGVLNLRALLGSVCPGALG